MPFKGTLSGLRAKHINNILNEAAGVPMLPVFLAAAAEFQVVHAAGAQQHTDAAPQPQATSSIRPRP